MARVLCSHRSYHRAVAAVCKYQHGLVIVALAGYREAHGQTHVGDDVAPSIECRVLDAAAHLRGDLLERCAHTLGGQRETAAGKTGISRQDADRKSVV